MPYWKLSRNIRQYRLGTRVYFRKFLNHETWSVVFPREKVKFKAKYERKKTGINVKLFFETHT